MPPPVQDDAEDRRVRAACTRQLSHHPVVTMRERLEQLAALSAADDRPDGYGRGGPVPELERRVAEILGKPAAIFVIKGVIAQQAALRAWCERRRRMTVVLHPLSHLANDEDGALERLHPIFALRLGGAEHFAAADLDGVKEEIGAVTLELPLRRAGYRLPAWDDLVAIAVWCRDHHVPFHLDGARLWEAAAGYERPVADLAALADSVYVSFYKGLGGLAGCALAGDEAFLEEVRPWAARLGANLPAAYPYVLSALDGLDHHLPKMSAYRDRAVRLAAALGEVPDIVVEPPQVNAFRVHLPGSPLVLRRRHRALAEQSGVWLFGGFAPSPLPGHAAVEIGIGEAVEELDDDEICTAVENLVNN